MRETLERLQGLKTLMGELETNLREWERSPFDSRREHALKTARSVERELQAIINGLRSRLHGG